MRGDASETIGDGRRPTRGTSDERRMGSDWRDDSVGSMRMHSIAIRLVSLGFSHWKYSK